MSDPAVRSPAAFGRTGERLLLAAIIVLVLGFAGAVTWANVQNTNIGLLPLRSVDEYAFNTVFSRMYNSLHPFDAQHFFNISYFTYGFPYFFFQLILLLPAEASHDFSSAIIIERSFSLAWTIATLLLGAWWIRRRTGSWIYGLLAVCAMIAMPGFVRMTTIAHPDTMMNFFLLAAFVTVSEGRPGWRTNVLAGLLCGLGACAKIQIAVYVPFVALLAAAQASGPGFQNWRRGAIACLTVGALTPAVYLALNPFLILSRARAAFLGVYKMNMDSNATNHFTYVFPSSTDKLQMLQHFYFSVPVVIVIGLIALGPALRNGKRLRDAMPELALLLAGLISGLYIFLTVQKAWGWDSYYMTSFTLIAVALPSLAGIAAPGGLFPRVAGAIALAVLMFFIGVRLPSTMTGAVVDDAPSLRVSAPVVSTLANLEKRVSPMTILVTPYTPFEFQKLGVRPDQISVIWTPIDDFVLKPANVVVIRKADEMFDRAALARNDPRGEGLRQSRGRIRAMQEGTDKDFVPCGEDNIVLVFCRHSSYRTNSL